MVSGSGESGEGEGAPPQEFIVEDLGDDPAAATAASGAVFGTERVVIGSAAAEAMFAALMDVTHPKLAFPCGLHVIHLLLNDYRYALLLMFNPCTHICVLCVCLSSPVTRAAT